MIVLDEQLIGRGLEAEISKWYRGSVRLITDLRPNSVIKDDNIPALLHRQNQPTFVTINERDFWLDPIANRAYCIVCVALPDSQAAKIPALLRHLLGHVEFNTKRKRCGKVVRITTQSAAYYAVAQNSVISFDFP